MSYFFSKNPTIQVQTRLVKYKVIKLEFEFEFEHLINEKEYFE